MEDKQIAIYDKNALLDIFDSEEDKREIDLLKMSNFFDIFVSKIDTHISTKGKWETVIC